MDVGCASAIIITTRAHGRTGTPRVSGARCPHRSPGHESPRAKTSRPGPEVIAPRQLELCDANPTGTSNGGGEGDTSPGIALRTANSAEHSRTTPRSPETTPQLASTRARTGGNQLTPARATSATRATQPSGCFVFLPIPNFAAIFSLRMRRETPSLLPLPPPSALSALSALSLLEPRRLRKLRAAVALLSPLCAGPPPAALIEPS